MLGEDKNLKDSSSPSPLKGEGWGEVNLRSSMSYTKTNKLVTAVYMVTDIMDINEPMRFKLRSLAVDILSDTRSTAPLARTVLASRIEEVLSLLDIISTVGMISEMNCNILKKEFIELRNSLGESIPQKEISLSELFLTAPEPLKDKGHSIGRIGVQKGSTLMKAISDKMPLLNNSNNNFESIKKERREEIIRIIKDKHEATIKDIKDNAGGVLASCGEKTLQRELISMVGDGVLNKAGSKRWSRYFLPK